MLHLRLTLLLSMLVLSTAAATAVVTSRPGDADAIKVGFIYNFSRFIRWPQPTTGAANGEPAGPFVIAVIGDSAMRAQLTLLEQPRYRVNSRPIRIQAVTNPAAIPNCAILFIGDAATAQIDAILRQLGHRPTLTIADHPGLAARGVAINFYRQRDRLRFEINPAALQRAGLSVEAQLFDVARIVP